MSQSEFNPLDGELNVKVGKPHNLNVTLTGEMHEKLNRLVGQSGLTKAVLIRQLIEWRYQHECQCIPVCANGARCFVPQHHAPPPLSPHQSMIAQPAQTRKVGP